MSLVVSLSELASIFRTSEESVRTWTANDALPCLRRGSPGVEARYPLPEAVQWLVERERRKEMDNPSGARQEFIRTRTQREQLKLLQESAKLVDAEAVRRAAFTTARVVRDALSLIPERMAARLAHETDPIRVQHLLAQEIRLALEELARPVNLGAGEPQESGQS